MVDDRHVGIETRSGFTMSRLSTRILTPDHGRVILASAYNGFENLFKECAITAPHMEHQLDLILSFGYSATVAASISISQRPNKPSGYCSILESHMSIMPYTSKYLQFRSIAMENTIPIYQ